MSGQALLQSGTSLPVHNVRQLWRNLTGALSLTRADVWLASFPRSGNSWFRTIVANLVLVNRGNSEGINPAELDSLMPTLGIADLSAPWKDAPIPRFVKTHRAYIPGLFGRPGRSVLLIRDPRDAMNSWFRLAAASTIRPFRGTFAQFIRHWRYGLPAYERHFSSWADRATRIVRYEALRSDPLEVVRDTFGALGVALPAASLQRAVELSHIERMREIEQRHGLRDPGRFKDGYRAVGTGESAGWKGRFSAADLDYFHDFMRRHPRMPRFD